MAELTSSTREAARRLGVSDTTIHKAERTGRITREPDGRWDIAKTRARLLDTADPQRSPLSGSAAAEGTPRGRHGIDRPRQRLLMCGTAHGSRVSVKQRAWAAPGRSSLVARFEMAQGTGFG